MKKRMWTKATVLPCILSLLLTVSVVQADTPGAAVDWRDYGGVNYVPPVRTQHLPGPGCGACWAFASIAAFESATMLANGGTAVDLSEQLIIDCDYANYGCDGGNISPGGAFIKKWGVPLESYRPYTEVTGVCPTTQGGWQSASRRATNYTFAAAATSTALKDYIWHYGPVATVFDVFDDFYSYSSGIYSHVIGDWAGGHAVLAIGYSDADGGYFIVKNSWGPDWGEGPASCGYGSCPDGQRGYFRIAYSEVAGVVHFGEEVVYFYNGIHAGAPSIAVTQPVAQTCVSPGGKALSAWTATGTFGTDATVSLYQSGLLVANFSIANLLGLSTQSSTYQGMNTGVVPGGTPTGANYRIKVTSNAEPNYYSWSPSFTVAPDGGSHSKFGRMGSGGKVSNLGAGGKVTVY